MDKAIVLMSGGVNSAVAAAIFKQRCEIFPLFVQFGQRATLRETAAFEALCEHFDTGHAWQAELTHFRQVGGNALLDPHQAITPATALPSEPADTFVPGLMPALLDVAASFAARIQARHIVIGIAEAVAAPEPGTAVLYPDSRREFLLNYQYMLSAALSPRSELTVEAPLADFDQAEIVKLGVRLSTPFELTWSCYDGGDTACGECFACASRALGFLEAGVADPAVVPSETPG